MPKKHRYCRLFQKILYSSPDFGLKKTEYDIKCLIFTGQSAIFSSVVCKLSEIRIEVL